MSKKNKVMDIGLNFSEALVIVFVVLKLTGYIDWSWWMILSPFWIPIAITLAVIVILNIALVIVKLLGG